MFKLPNLPYDYSALEPAIDTDTMILHHTKHHQTYIDNANSAIDIIKEQQPNMFETLSEIFNDQGEYAVMQYILTQKNTFGDVHDKLINNTGGHLNHSFFWKAMQAPTDNNQPSDELKSILSTHFGSLDNFKAEFEQAAISRFGSGWAWLVKDNHNDLSIISTANQNSPIAIGLEPLLGLDVWEHAYYLRYNNRRADYIKNWWSVVNWNRVESLL